eukprot:CAMPEP_0206149164 /NCGR_PEP_ID=MMETSP1473-20131121/37633_1 /ASSEMBLY_ACC=CAM_ASM_001109 /TAXON_ID=1461547 /ORGANISM="Stichococcus sp, Strain RCC1054" /LENGTH=154 /DNA_ID=CAMNT_0053546613 /DNA_START=530 /DNA_END=994 /DNA_ORIENTATION=-
MSLNAHRAAITSALRPENRAAGRIVRPGRSQRHVMAALRLVPTGDGKSDHLDEPVTAPGALSLKDGSFTLGGGPTVDFKINVPTVSSSHARLDVEGSKLTVTDLGSTNGTTLDGQDLKPQTATTVSIGSQISFGDTHLAQFKLEDQPEAEPKAE